MVIRKITVALLALTALCACNNTYKTDSIGIQVSPDENREYSYTDKKAGYWYGKTYQDETEFWFGWNMAKKRILSDYILSIDGQRLYRKDAVDCVVYPERMERTWPQAKETFMLLDDVPIVVIDLQTKGKSMECSLDMEHLVTSEPSELGLMFTPKEAPENRILLAPLKKVPFTTIENGIQTRGSKGFILTYGLPEKCKALAGEFYAKGNDMIVARKDRINSLITDYNLVTSNLPELDKALDWITITMDELITCQQGNGIYAGLPWFNEYWGRDMFISMPGACLVTGQFEVAKQILKDFIQLQDKDPESPTYGRIPNRANLEGILYNTTDGTPRLVSQALELAQYSGDTDFLKDIYPAIKLSIDASIKNYADQKGYLTHADADTWMDVKRNGIPGSPRGNRANDIQALWYSQLIAGSKIAEIVGDKTSAEQWLRLSDKLAANFENDFCDKKANMIYDHLNSDSTPDLQFRPNQLFCFDLVRDENFKKQVTRRVWEELVYPWGTASLAQWDQQFHPQHENWHYYHKDDAYHNGTIWLWNNGIAMQRMIEYGQKETAWKLFCNMGRQALKEGAVGSLSENADAHPRPGCDWVNLSGTFLQAWSNAEYLRVWYQYFLGIRPDLLNGTIIVEPNLPAEIKSLVTSVKIGNGTLLYVYDNGQLIVTGDNIDAEIKVVNPTSQADDPAFEGVDFCKVNPLPSYPCMSKYHETEITYF